MTTDLANLKAALREEVRARLMRLSRETCVSAGAMICARFWESDTWKNAKAVLLFAPLAHEPDVWPLAETGLSAGKRLGLPRFVPGRAGYSAAQLTDLARDIVVGKFQIREPAVACPELALAGFDLVLVPGVAFDPRGRRLGKGRGYYDQMLAEVRGTKCGVAFDEQFVNEVPVEAHDICMDCILTPTRWVEVGKR